MRTIDSPGDRISATLRKCSKEVEGEVGIIYDFRKGGGYMQSNTHFGKGLLLITGSRSHC